MASEIEPIQPRESKMTHSAEMRYRALANQIRSVKSYGLGNPEITHMLGLGRLPRQNIIIEEAQRIVAEYSSFPPEWAKL